MQLFFIWCSGKIWSKTFIFGLKMPFFRIYSLKHLCSKGPWTNKKKQDWRSRARGLVKLQFSDWKKCLKMTVRKMSNILWLSKTSHNGSNKALFESRSKLKSKIHKRAVEQKSLLLWIVQKFKENKGNFTIFILYLRK